MAGVYRPRHPERTVLYRVLFHHFDRFLTSLRLQRPQPHIYRPGDLAYSRQGPSDGSLLAAFMGTPTFIDHLKLGFVAAKPPPSHVFEQVALIAAEESGEYF